ncbi:L-cysteine desulfidase [Sporomusaceae bacterium BoRhaA]|uniref:L-cysteine desulfidase family protein n=1 Tax=Pelorhabdus rhamnosifermentans TaxID=2772457 RepID=UPI001C062348|nr:L-serine ammonia-lyase, iron-sulfur-dependent, subunit alpha [Pelorhabdus rhamnosifermentans]MBU2700376.1 L-cysteine desulfidase [Pelorhabdus rhamnosifermentans]
MKCTLNNTVEEQKIFGILNQELVVALGCTEPIAIAYAAALAKQFVKDGDILSVQVAMSGNIIKNAMSVTIPGTSICGINAATALGIVAGNPDKKLEVLSGITQNHVKQAQDMIEAGIISASVANTSKKLYIEAVVHSKKSYAKVVIADHHTGVVLIEVDGQAVYKEDHKDNACDELNTDSLFLNLDRVWQFAMEVDTKKLDIVKESIKLNKRVALEGLANVYGLQVGRSIRDSIAKGILTDDFATWAMALTAAGSDARMAGCSLPVMSNSGSGNQGLCATLPVVAVGEKLEIDDEKMIRAVALSHLITIYIKSKFGRLSALCGATIAGTGASCGITYLLGGDLIQVKYAVQNMLGNVTGMLCDGAKAGCAMKVSTCVNAAVQSAVMAREQRSIQSTDGIIEADVDRSIDNLCQLGNQGTLEADKIILEIMLNKKVG